MFPNTYPNADQDIEARKAIWKAISVAGEEVRCRFNIKSICYGNGTSLKNKLEVPAIQTWKLVEALCLLGVLIRSEEASADNINLTGKTGPIEFKEDGIIRWLWAQQTLVGDKSALNGIPDLIVTSTRDAPNPSNAIRIIEAKCVKNFGTQNVRAEFGKAHDLRVSTYIIWSFFSPQPRIIEGAKGLGINLEALGFDTKWRSELINQPDALIARVSYAQEVAKKETRFAKVLEDASKEARMKLMIVPKK